MSNQLLLLACTGIVITGCTIGPFHFDPIQSRLDENYIDRKRERYERQGKDPSEAERMAQEDLMLKQFNERR